MRIAAQDASKLKGRGHGPFVIASLFRVSYTASFEKCQREHQGRLSFSQSTIGRGMVNRVHRYHPQIKERTVNSRNLFRLAVLATVCLAGGAAFAQSAPAAGSA